MPADTAHRNESPSEAQTAQWLGDASHMPKLIKDGIEQQVHRLRTGPSKNLAWVIDLANRLEDVLSDADVFCALRLADTGEDAKMATALGLLTEQAR